MSYEIPNFHVPVVTPTQTDTYCCVSVARQTQNTVTIWQQLSPCWDQTLVFKDIPIVGNIREIREALPQVTINVYHRGPLVRHPLSCSRDRYFFADQFRFIFHEFEGATFRFSSELMTEYFSSINIFLGGRTPRNSDWNTKRIVWKTLRTC